MADFKDKKGDKGKDIRVCKAATIKKMSTILKKKLDTYLEVTTGKFPIFILSHHKGQTGV